MNPSSSEVAGTATVPSVRGALRVEGACLLVAAVAGYAVTGASWWLFAVLLLAPDASALGYAVGRSWGSRTYNLAHATSLPSLLLAVGLGLGWEAALPYAAICFAHIGMDRALGYGLKRPGSFDRTHLGPIGRRA